MNKPKGFKKSLSSTQVTFLHPDLGIGGAERAIIDAACGMQDCGFRVNIVTNYHDPKHCFPETTNGTLSVKVVGNWLPRSILGKCQALCAYVRFIYLAMFVCLVKSYSESNLLFVDQISAPIPVLKLFGFKVLFYCHFPDMLLTQRKTFLKKVYRFPLDWVEEFSTGKADQILVNSKFTKGIFHSTFTKLSAINPLVLYPVPNFPNLDSPDGQAVSDTITTLFSQPQMRYFISINRYERKKNIALALDAMSLFLSSLPQHEVGHWHLIIAGGYDPRVVENVEYHRELVEQATRLQMDQHVTFLRSCSDKEKVLLLQTAQALLYTPSHEHFGIVPVEAMYLHCPVIAINNGGPLETVLNTVTGFLVDAEPKLFQQSMQRFLEDGNLKKTMGNSGHERVTKLFSHTAFRTRLRNIICDMIA